MKTGQRSPNCVEQSLRLYDVLEVGFLVDAFCCFTRGFSLGMSAGSFWLALPEVHGPGSHQVV